VGEWVGSESKRERKKHRWCDTCGLEDLTSLEVLEVVFLVIVQTHKLERRARLLGHNLPRHKVGVVLHDAEDNLISLSCERTYTRRTHSSVRVRRKT